MKHQGGGVSRSLKHRVIVAKRILIELLTCICADFCFICILSVFVE